MLHTFKKWLKIPIFHVLIVGDTGDKSKSFSLNSKLNKKYLLFLYKNTYTPQRNKLLNYIIITDYILHWAINIFNSKEKVLQPLLLMVESNIY